MISQLKHIVQAIFFKKSHSLSQRLTVWLLFFIILPLSIVSWLSYQQAHISLTKAIAEQLEQSSVLTGRFIQNWFEDHLTELKKLAVDNDNILLFERFTTLAAGSDRPLSEYIQSKEWKAIVENSSDDLVNLVRYFPSIADLMLIDLKGNLLYSVKRDKTLGVNILFSGVTSSQFSDGIHYVLKNTQVSLSEPEYFEPAGDLITSFISMPVMNNRGEMTGVISMRLAYTPVLALMKSARSKGSSRTQYLVDQNGLLISPIQDSDKTQVLKRVVKNVQDNGWQVNSGPGNTSSRLADNDSLTYTGPDGVEVIGVHQAITLANKQFLLISEITKNEALAGTIWLKKITFWVVLLVIILIVVAVVYQIRRITRPLSELAQISADLAAGKNVEPLEISGSNEIGKLAESFNHMLEVRREQEYLLAVSSQHAEQVMAELVELKFALDQHAIVAMTDIQGTITFVNDKFTEISGYSRHELIGKNHRLLNSGYHDIEVFKEMYRTIARGQVWHGELCNRAKDGHLYWVDTTIVPFKGDNGKPEKYVAIRADITERKKAEAALITAKNEAENAVKVKSEFLASMSHEIRTPMNGVIGMLNLLLNMNLEADQRHRAFIAQNSAQSLLNLINDILDFSKIEAGKLELEMLDFNLRKMLDNLAESMAQQAEDKDLEIIIDTINIAETTVRGDPGRLRQIFINLIGNAIKFTHHGEIRITASLQPNEEGHHALVAQIRDTGIGISADKLNKLFNSFSQLDASTTRKYGGTGLGLAIAKKLCKLMDGSITVSSQPGQGSSFEIRVILEKSLSSRPVVPPPGVKNLTILLIEDNKTAREVLSAQLEFWGATVVPACSGQEALDKCNERLRQPESAFFDLALLDMQLPDMNGMALAKLIRQESQFNQMKLVMMTSMKQQSEGGLYTEAGFSGYFPKPVTTMDLFRALSVVVKQPETENQASIENRLMQPFTQTESAVLHNKTQWPENYRILLVEDNHVNQLVASGILNDFGLATDVAVNGIDALRKMRQADSQGKPYTLVLMDCQMPEMDGFEASRQIRKGNAGALHQSVIIAAMTANAMLGDREKCIEAGMNDYISKPVDADLLYLNLHQWLTGKRPEQTVQGIKNIPDPASSMADLAVWDKPTILKRIGGSEHSLKRLIEAFLIDISKNIKELKEVIKESNIEKIRHLSHTIKGVAGNITGYQMQNIALQIETHARNGQLDQLDSLFTDLEVACQQLTKQMEESLANDQDESPVHNVLSQGDLRLYLEALKNKLIHSEYIDPTDLEPLRQTVQESAISIDIDTLIEKIMMFDNESAVKLITQITKNIDN